MRLEALGLAAEQYEKSGDAAQAVPLLEKLVAQYPTPVAERIETRQKLADYAARAGNAQRVAYWQQRNRQGRCRCRRRRAPTARDSSRPRPVSRWPRPSATRFRALKLTAPLTKSLAPKRRALDAALDAYKSAAAYNIADVATQANFEIAELYRQLAEDLMDSERPKKMSDDELRAVRPAAGGAGLALRGAGHRAA